MLCKFRTKVKFAWFPRFVEDHVIIFEKYLSLQMSLDGNIWIECERKLYEKC